MRAYDDDDVDDDEESASSDNQSFDSGTETNGSGDEKGTETKVGSECSLSRFLPGPERDLLPGTGRVEAALYEANRARLLRVQEEARAKRAMLEAAFLEESRRSALRLEQVKKQEEAKFDMTRRHDNQYQRSVAEDRDQYLSVLQRDHQLRSLVEERKLRKEEEAAAARRRELAELERQKAEARKEAERLAAAERERNQRQAEEAAAAQRAEADRKEAERQAKELASVNAGPKPLVSELAALAEENRKKIMAALDQASNPLVSNPGLKERLSKSQTQLAKLLVQLVPDNVRRISSDLLRLLSDELTRPFLISKLAQKALSHCETRVSIYPLAQVIVGIGSTLPELMDAVLAKLNVACILTVPKFYLYKQTIFSSRTDYLKAIGYIEKAGTNGELEPLDEYMARQNAYMTFYAAIVQTEGPNRHGLENGWRWLAEVLNRLPPNRYTASALHSFLEAAGYALYRRYGKSFVKLMDVVKNKFIPAFKQKDPSASNLHLRLQTYLLKQSYLSSGDK